MSSPIKITDKLSIPISELKFTASRSSGPGGQNVNKVNTRVTLLFDVVNSPTLSVYQKELIRDNLPTRINKAGILRVVSQKYRSQAQNRDTAIERFILLLLESLKGKLPRKETMIPNIFRQRRINEKKHRSVIKKSRSKQISLDD